MSATIRHLPLFALLAFLYSLIVSLMPPISVHLKIVSREKELLSQLLHFQPENRSIDHWLVIIAYNKASHHIDLAAHYEGIIKDDTTVFTESDRVDFLTSRDITARRWYHKMYTVAAFLQYGIMDDDIAVKQALKLFQDRPARQFVPKFLEVIEKALK